MSESIQEKINTAVEFLQHLAASISDIELCYSGGKDSEVILELARMADIPFTAIYKNTTIDPPYTIKHCQDKGVLIQEPRIRFFQMIEKHGFPTRRARFCCRELKEYKIKDIAILGIRREESRKRAELYQEPIVCKIYSKEDHVNQVLPILDWTLHDIQAFVEKYNIKLHPLYYRSDGTIDYSRRLGCLGCPLQSDCGLEDFKRYPKLLKQWLKHGKIWWETHPNIESHIKFKDIYALFAHNIFFDNYSDYEAANISLFGEEDWKQRLEDYFNIYLD